MQVSVSSYQEGKFEFNRIMGALMRNMLSHYGRCVVAGTTENDITTATNYIMHVQSMLCVCEHEC